MDYISKPFSIPVVMARVGTHLAMHAAHVQLKQQYIALQELEKLRKDVEAITRHDLRTPISGILGCTELLLTDDQLSPTELKEFHQMIRDAANRLQEMVNMSMHLINMEQGRYEAVLQPLPLLPILQRILVDHRVWIDRKQLATLITIDGQPAQDRQTFTVLGDKTLCYTLFANLCKNALEASPTGQTVTIALQTGNRTAAIAIHNQGAVPEAIRDTFFDKYVTHGKQGGTGLGTYSARLMAETQQGSIHLHSSEQEGTTITVTLLPPEGAP
ncbi:MAG: ATP-binding protein [Magnetococcus sp. DMHC-8]